MNFRQYFSIVFVYLVLSFTCLAFGQETNRTVNVSVTGLEDNLLKNVLSSVAIAKQQKNGRITESMVNKLYDQANEEIAKALEPFGYYSPSIQKNIKQVEESWHVELHILPGEPVRLTEIDIRLTGPGAQDAQLREGFSRYQFPLSKDDILNHQLYEQGKKKLISGIIASGYREVSFKKNIVRVNRKELQAQIILVFDTGRKYLFGKTHFDADFISTDLLNRMLPYVEGEPFSPRKIVKMRQTFLNSDYFSKVDVRTGDALPGTLSIPIYIQLRPKRFNKYSIGIGYGTDTGARGSLEWTNRLLNRYGHQLNVLLQPSERKSNVGIAYTIPVNDPRNDRLSIVGKWEKEYYDNTETEARYTIFSYEHKREIGEYSVYLQYLDEDYEIGLETGHATFLHPGVKSTWRWTDDRLKTSRGLRFTLDITGATSDIVSDAGFLQTSINTKSIYSFFESWRMIGRLQFGWTQVDNVKDLSPSLRFYAGGDQSVRGFGYKSIGPTDSAGNVVGASHLLTYSLEIERLLFGNWSAAVFLDSGDAMDSLSDLNMHTGIGVGIRWNAPFGQVRLDVAEGISEGEDSWRIHFNVGADL